MSRVKGQFWDSVPAGGRFVPAWDLSGTRRLSRGVPCVGGVPGGCGPAGCGGWRSIHGLVFRAATLSGAARGGSPAPSQDPRLGGPAPGQGCGCVRRGRPHSRALGPRLEHPPNRQGSRAKQNHCLAQGPETPSTDYTNPPGPPQRTPTPRSLRPTPRL